MIYVSDGVEISAEEWTERVRRALAEVGYPPEAVFVDLDGIGRFETFLVPHEVMWRARCTLKPSPLLCFACWSSWTNGDNTVETLPDCCATVPVQDCGRDR